MIKTDDNLDVPVLLARKRIIKFTLNIEQIIVSWNSEKLVWIEPMMSGTSTRAGLVYSYAKNTAAMQILEEKRKVAVENGCGDRQRVL